MISVIDYQLGNLFSVCRAFEAIGHETKFVHTPEEILTADLLVLPGVGAFKDGMQELEELNLIPAIQEYARQDRPFLGICLGMQMMLDKSYEFGEVPGLGLISGEVKKIAPCGTDSLAHKVPHVGWNALVRPGKSPDEFPEHSILKGIKPGSFVYFVHSFTAYPHDPKHRLSDADYNGRQLSAVISNSKITGCQFHPEKSGEIGLQILKNFVELY